MSSDTYSIPGNTYSKFCLLVAADASTETMLSNLLEGLGWRYERAHNNKAAFEKTIARPFDLIVTGEKTSGKEDVELLRQIRKVHPHTRMIILTDESTPADVIESMRARAFSYFSKPYARAT